jgi:prepilin-type N-terminal cleavage/methylation domain-containing protein
MAGTASRTTPNLGSQPLRGADFERAHSSVVLGEDVRDQRRGFTIVELLIVVVVVAILAAVTVVAYNGITNRAKATAAATAAEQAAKKVMTYAAVNSDQYPSSLWDAGVADGSATYQYRVDNNASPRTFCLTATTRNVSYWVSSSAPAPASGACAGHGVDGGGTITNLATNGGLETNTAGWSGGNGGGTITRSTSRASTGSASGSYVSGGAATNDAGAQFPITLVAGRTYTATVRVYQTTLFVPGQGIRIGVYANGWVGVGAYSSAVGAWTTVSVTFTANGSPGSFVIGAPQTQAPATSAFSFDDLMITEGTDAPVFADGASPGWIWNGTTNNSTSTGPAL